MTIHVSKRAAGAILITALLVVPGVAFATHQFDDVSDTGSHVPGIEWLAASGVTAGCDSDNYCPNDNVTRAQMATFMYRLSGNAAGITPSVNAASVDGMELVTEAIAVSIPFGESRTLATNGPLTIFANCTQDEGGSDYLRVFVESSESGSYWGTSALTTNVAEEDEFVSTSTGDIFNFYAWIDPLLVAAGGETLNFNSMYTHVILNAGGHDCFITTGISAYK